MVSQQRCWWAASGDALYQEYHDIEWGAPLDDDTRLFEFLVLEGAQAGLSWYTILKKRAAYREAFAAFDPQVVAAFDEDMVAQLLANPGIVRNELKIRSAIRNAQRFLEVQREYGSFDAFIWGLADGRPRQNQWANFQEVPATTAVSDAMSKALKARGFTFVGSTICYAFMQATGMVNDHTTDCFRWSECAALA